LRHHDGHREGSYVAEVHVRRRALGTHRDVLLLG
jgi:hypothetical protein